jgi:Peptidase family S41
MSRTVAEPRETLPGSLSLADFLASVTPISIEARYRLVGEARRLLEGAYVHLRLKQAMHAVDPVQRLRLLERRLPSMTDRQFHAELRDTFRSLRDLHTGYQLPDPYRGHVATLGFLVERYHAGRRDEPRYLVTRVHSTLARGGFGPGAEISSWNGIPIEDLVRLNAERESGSNADAQLARGLESLTLRPLRSTLPPDEHWASIEFQAGSRVREIRIPWRVVPAGTTPAGAAQDPVATTAAFHGIDAGNEATRQVKRALFADAKARAAESLTLRNVLRVDTVSVRRGQLGYVRIYSFNVGSARQFVRAFARVLAALPETGLIVDIRGNPGGHIPAAEGVLQLLTREPIEPVRFSLTTTPFILALCDSHPSFRPWVESVESAVETGEDYSQGFPLSAPAELVRGLRRYRGPAVLVTDPLCYSAADIFAAGFQDNGVGAVLGTAGFTGAGGANVWAHDLLRLWLPDEVQQLPEGTGFRVALRRATRVGPTRAGVPLEDLGVRADEVHLPTRRDVTERNQDLLAAAARLL